MTSPESPAVQDTDRLREVAARVQWYRDRLSGDGLGEWDDAHESDRREYLLDAAAVLAAVLPVHRETVLRQTASPLAALSRWIDDHPANATRNPEARAWGRIAKIGEEAGEVIAAMIAVTGQNPRKPVVHFRHDVPALLADHARLALDIQARDIAVREAGWLREQVEAERDRAVLALGDLRGREALLVAERDDARESAASILNDAGERVIELFAERNQLAETNARMQVERDDALALVAACTTTQQRRLAETIRRAHLLVDQLNEQGTTKVTAAIVAALLAAALGDIPSPTAPEAPDDLDRFIAEQMHDPEFRAAWERQAGRPLLDEATARAAGWLPLNEVLAVLRDDEGMWEWAEQFGPSRNACIVSISDRELLALYLTERFAPQPADTKETTTDG